MHSYYRRILIRRSRNFTNVGKSWKFLQCCVCASEFVFVTGCDRGGGGVFLAGISIHWKYSMQIGAFSYPPWRKEKINHSARNIICSTAAFLYICMVNLRRMYKIYTLFLCEAYNFWYPFTPGTKVTATFQLLGTTQRLSQNRFIQYLPAMVGKVTSFVNG